MKRGKRQIPIMSDGKPSNRRIMREVVFRSIYQLDFHGDMDTAMEFIEKELRHFSLDTESKSRSRRYFEEIVRHIESIDEVIREQLENWNFDRLASIDKNVLRLGTYELIYEKTVPVEVTLNEAIEIAKKYGSEQGGRFVNGVLDRIARKYVPEEKKGL